MSNSEKSDPPGSLREKRISVYSDFMKSFGRSIITKKVDAQELTKFNMEIALIGGDPVLKNFLVWQELQRKYLGTKEQEGLWSVFAQFGKVCLEMRRELNPSTELGIKDVLRSFIRDLDTQPRLLKLIDEIESKKAE